MANEKHLAIIRSGVDVWNNWRETTHDVEIDLSGANLKNAKLIGANFVSVNFTRANLSGADLESANLNRAELVATDLIKTCLYSANLGEANLRGSNFLDAKVANTLFVNVDLSEVIGLDNILHRRPSTIGLDTIAKSKGSIPKVFLQGCGLSDADIEYAKLTNPDLSNEEINKILYRIYDLRASQAIQISPLFVSYNHTDGKFVDKIETQLNKRGIRFWRDIHDMKAGRMEKQIDRAIRQNPTVLLILSEHSLNSDWVEHEVRTARQLEKDMERDVLCPVALDDSWKSSHWPKRIMEQITEYNILDFSEWEDDVKFEGMFRRLIDGLELFYKG